MPSPAELVSLLVVVEFVVLSAVVVLLVPLEVAAPILPLLLVFLVVLHQYWSSDSSHG